MEKVVLILDPHSHSNKLGFLDLHLKLEFQSAFC